MKILDRYIHRLLFAAFLNVLGIFVGLLFVQKLYKIIELAVKQSLSIGETLPLFLWALPPVLLYAGPIAFLAATLVVFGKLATENEIIAALAAGVRRRALARPPLLFSTALAGILVFNNVFLVPESYVYYDNVGFGVKLDPIKALQPGKVSRLKGRFLSVADLDGDEHRFEKLFAILPGQDIGGNARNGRMLVLARGGGWRMEDQFVLLALENGSVENLGEAHNVRRTIHFQKLNLHIPLPRDRSPDPKRLGIFELVSKYLDPGTRTAAQAIEFTRRFGHALVIPLLAAAALPFVLSTQGGRRRSTSRGAVAYAFVIYFLFWILSFAAEMFVENYHFPALTLLLPYLIIAALAGALWMVKK